MGELPMKVRDVTTDSFRAVRYTITNWITHFKSQFKRSGKSNRAKATGAYPFPPLTLSNQQFLTEATRGQALQIACEELEILADLLEAYFIEKREEKLQQQAIRLARSLANKICRNNYNRKMTYPFDIEFEKLSRVLLTLKKCRLKTDTGLLWTDIMRPSARTVALSISRFNELQGDEQENLNKSNSKLNITYASLQRRVYLPD